MAAVEAGDDLLQLLELHPGVVDRRSGLANAQARRIAARIDVRPSNGLGCPAASSRSVAASRRSAPCC